MKIIEVAILSLTALLIGLFVARPLIARMFGPLGMTVQRVQSSSPVAGELPAPDNAAQGEDAENQQLALPSAKPSMIDVAQIEGQVRESSINKVGEVVSSHPEEALAIIRTWLHEPA